MGTKSSIHVKTISGGSEAHNQRTKTISYVVTEFTPDNESFVLSSIANTRLSIEAKYLKSVGQKMQKFASPIREGVLIIEKQHGVKDLKDLAAKIESRFGIRTIQAYAHKDEGHKDLITNEWKPNYHAHMVFDWTNEETGKTIKMSKEDMSEMQTMVAESLKLERGVKSTKSHINAMQFKIQEEKKSLDLLYNVKNVLPEAVKLIKQVKPMREELKLLGTSKNSLSINILELERIKKEKEIQIRNEEIKQEQLRSKLENLENEKRAEINELVLKKQEIEDKTKLSQANLEYIKEKTVKIEDNIKAKTIELENLNIKVSRSIKM